ncbi:hypothetical protein V500_07318 [Pseudogymnoascus sp. VKM F-4518 (FW-2643)]|nr:hypothetical protein V500_07318 [Pseudogymnoascus sp. VKM F-4518 (FW-2643)]
MTASQQTAYLNAIHGTATTLGPSTNANQPGTSAGTVGSTTACGHGDHPHDHANDTGLVLPTCRIGPQQEDLDGEQMADPGEGKVMDEQLEKKHAGWVGEDSLTAELDRKKREQAAKRERFEEERRRGRDVDGGGAVRLVDDDTSAV